MLASSPRCAARSSTSRRVGLGGATSARYHVVSARRRPLTAYTFIASRARVRRRRGRVLRAAYTIIMYPLVFMVLPRLWTVCRAHGYVTPADFVRAATARAARARVACTGLLATMPYIALQLVGMQVVLGALGVEGDWPLIIAFVSRRLHVPGGSARAGAHRDRQGPAHLRDDPRRGDLHPVEDRRLRRDVRHGREGAATHTPKPGALSRSAQRAVAYATLALGSALALSLSARGTAVLSARARRRSAQHRSAARLHVPARHIALLGYMAIARGIKPSNPNFAVPDCSSTSSIVVRRHRVRGDRDRCAVRRDVMRARHAGAGRATLRRDEDLGRTRAVSHARR